MIGVSTGLSTAGVASAAPAVELRGAAADRGARRLWSDLDLEVGAGELIAILGPNGSGKTTLLTVLLGLLPLAAGPWTRRSRRSRRRRPRAIADALHQVGADAWGDAPVGRLSGGEQQRLRVAQALVGDPDILLCDEPLLSLDLAHQRVVVDLIDRRRREHDTVVLFVTHELNPVLPVVDRVLYLVDGRFRIATPDEVMTSGTLSELYRTPVDVVRVRDRILVVGHENSPVHHTGEHDELVPATSTLAS